ncbi:alpha/beta fold hydrolase [Psychromicrobium lacuslunae]|uniref:Proline iminopeptidase n=1 Tax=Psychromicrobium lacuslunae TaxID=1618207 RepID=A0A0D4C123_9MICC|nr:alpha/beta fold hydrolase [Psychromicrobium lacuslunae]AJT42293.1 proline iminopeptidase [Psychromicrobium lacuslunae]
MQVSSYWSAGVAVTDRQFQVPLDWAQPQHSAKISLFVRELSSAENKDREVPVLLYLQGGPGGSGPRPTPTSGWIKTALQYYRIVLLDQRGTGRSQPISAAQFASFSEPESAADYLSKFGADSIIRDAEYLREHCYQGQQWSTLGQSYGGFLTLSYLSFFPEALRSCLIAGGLPSLLPSAEEVYRRTYPRVRRKNANFYQQYPDDQQRVAKIADILQQQDIRLPDGDRLSVRRFQSLGLDFGMKPGFERLHWLLDEAFEADGESLASGFLEAVQRRTSFRGNPLFAVLQENIYRHGANGATNWAADREAQRHPDFAADQRPLLFTGEMIYRWMFEEISELAPFRAAADLLAQREQHAPLYDLERLASNEVPVAAAVYFDDMYVDCQLQLETAERVGNLRTWVTNEFEHDGIGQPGVFERLRQMITDNGGSI